MNQNDQDTNPNPIDQAAAEWAVRLESRALTTDEQADLDEWLSSDSRRPGALLRARAAWTDLDRLAALRGRPTDAQPATATHTTYRLLPKSSRRWLVAAGVTALMLGASVTWWSVSHRNVYVSDVGEVREVPLSDGSSMVLNTQTTATVKFDPVLREVDLATGEGLFQVTKDPKRPFVVRAGSVSVRAVGTVFSVRAVDQRVDVTVTEGVVELLDDSASGSALIRRVAANEHATVMDKHQVEVQNMAHDEAERRLAWRDGMVDFSGESLTAAVEEINRHNHRHIVVDGAGLGNRPVVGLFRTNDPDGFAQTVARALGAQSAEEEDAIHLRAR